MNLRYLREDVGKSFPFDPVPKSFTRSPYGEFIAPEFNWWTFDDLDEVRHLLFFSHVLGYCPKVSFSDFTAHQPGDIFKLRGQLIIRDPRCYVWPELEWRRAIFTSSSSLGRCPWAYN